MKTAAQICGFTAEQSAEAFLCTQGFSPITRNYQCKMGEIDLIMRDQDYLVFIEVRYRDQASHGSGAETITHSKKSKLIRTATHYLIENNLWDKVPCRFDVISLSAQTDIVWIKDAFWIEYR
jgi:putative endonuclease